MSLGTLVGLPGRQWTVDDKLSVVEKWVSNWRKPTALMLMCISVVLICLVAMAEIDRLIAGSLGTGDAHPSKSAPLGGVIGPASLAARDSWAIWLSNASTRESVGEWIVASVAFDLLFIATYTWLILALIKFRAVENRQTAHRIRLSLLVAADVFENLFLLGGAAALSSAAVADDAIDKNSVFAWAVGVIALAKWVFLVLVLIGLWRDEQIHKVVKRVMRRLAQALWLHRLSALLVAALFAVSCLPFDGVLDQLPDIQRQWIGEAWWHGVTAVIAVIVAALAAFALGRARTRTFIDVNIRKMTRFPAPRGTARWWLAPLAIALALWIYAWVGTGVWQVGPAIWVFALTPILALLVSLIPGDVPGQRRRRDAIGRAQYAWLGGDVIAVMLLVTSGVGLVRSFTAPVFLEPAESEQFTLGTWWIAVVLLILGMIIAIGSPFLLRLRRRKRNVDDTPSLIDPRRALIVPDPKKPVADDEQAQAAAVTWKWHRFRLGLIFGIGVWLLLLFTAQPIWFASTLGAVAITVTVLTAWGAVLGAFTLALQDYLPLRVFRRMRMRAAPVLTMAITIPLIAGIVFSEIGWDDPRLHSVRRDDSTTTSSNDKSPQAAEVGDDAATQVSKITEALDDRLGTIEEAACTLKGTSAIPVVVFVAEGGGIRAAYWTTRVLETLRKSDGCFRNSTLLSSSVSGGSVGVAIIGSGAFNDVATKAVAAETEAPSPGTVALSDLASPDTVATGVTGLLVSDLIASATGVRVPSRVEGTLGWRDRAALIELTWQHDIPKLKEEAKLDAHLLVGLPMLNSTDARTKCRVPVTIVPVAGDGGRCAQPVGAPAVTLPILDPCVETLDWAGAAMLSARFPIITPAGRLGEGDGDKPDAKKGTSATNGDACGNQTRQLIDGGYAEGSGLGTAADLAPLVASIIREQNADGGEKYLVPILVFAQNSAGYDLAEDLRAVSSEPLVPLVGAAAAGAQTTKSAWMQRISTAFSQVCPAKPEPATTQEPTDPVWKAREKQASECEAALGDVDESLPGLVVAVAPSTKPTVVPPLGWSLSSFSIASMERSLEDQVKGNGTDDDVADLHDLLELKKAE